MKGEGGITDVKKYGLFLGLTAILLVTAFFGWSYQVNAEGDSEGPVVEVISPQPGSTVKASEQQKVTLNVTDSAGIDTNAALQLDGQDVSSEIVWNESNQAGDETVSDGVYDTVVETTYDMPGDDHTKGKIVAALPELNPGEHSIYYKIKDSLGNVTQNTYVFTVSDDESPLIKNSYPPGSSVIKTATPTIALRLQEASKILNVSLYLDGNQVEAVFNNIHNTIRYAVTRPLHEGAHNIRLVVADENQNITDNEWSFVVDTSDTVVTDTGGSSEQPNTAVSTETTTVPDFSIAADGAVSLAAAAPETVELLATTLSIESSGPVVSDLNPVPDTMTDKTAPLFSFRFSDPDKVIDTSVVVKIDNQSVTPVVRYDDIYEIRYDSCTGQPYYVKVGKDPTKGTVTAQFPLLASGQHTIYYSLKDSLNNITENTYSFTVSVDSASPQILELTPSNGVVIADPKPVVKAKIVDSSPINSAQVQMKINGSPVPAVYNPITSYVTYTPPQPLKNGTYSIEVTAADMVGNPSFAGWSFTINDVTPPVISGLSPANNSAVATTTPAIAAAVTDPSGITNPVYLQVDGNDLEAQYQVQTGKVTYVPAPLSEGQHTVNMYVYDLQGNKSSASWVFNVHVSGPVITELSPAPGAIVESIRPVFSFSYSAPYGLNVSGTLTLDGKYVNTFVTWEGRNDYTKGKVIAQLPELSPGQHTIYYKFRDVLGNVSEKTYTFTVSDTNGPQITDMTPASGATIDDARPVITAKLNDTNIIVAESVYLTINGARVSSSYDSATKTVTCQPAQVLINGENTIQVFAADELGNSGGGSWSFSVNDVVPPQVSSQTPAPGTETGECKPLISAKLTDKNGLNPSSVVMKFNGAAVGSFDPASGVVSYKPAYGLAVGTYTVEVSAADVFNNPYSTSWSFTVKDSGLPQISNLVPAPGMGTQDVRPSISAYLMDSQGIDVGRITLSVDNAPLSVTFKPDISGSTVSGTVYASPTSDLTSAMHTVDLTVYDLAGNSQQKSWQFGVNMTANMDNCSTCHAEGLTALEEKHIAGATNCKQCHGRGLDYEHGLDQPAMFNCGKCHDGHLQGVPLPLEGFACTQCHNSTFWDVVPTHGSPTEANKHVYTDFGQECQECHSNNLMQAHTIGEEGTAATSNCVVCHQSTKAAVKTAISQHNVACSACHDLQVGHKDLHKSGIDQKCADCHAENLIDDHITNRTEANLSCNTCHTDAYVSVTDSVYGQGNSMLCSRCHTEGHGIKFTAVVPTDIPLYEGIEWTTPIDSEIFNEPWMPTEFAVGAKLLISKRSLNISGQEVWNFYNDQLTSMGWTLNSSAPSQFDFYDVTFTKKTRKVRISFYGGQNHTASPLVSTGYKIEILYK